MVKKGHFSHKIETKFNLEYFRYRDVICEVNNFN